MVDLKFCSNLRIAKWTATSRKLSDGYIYIYIYLPNSTLSNRIAKLKASEFVSNLMFPMQLAIRFTNF